MLRKKPIVVVGSINTDLVATAKKIPCVGETVIGTDFKIYPGGKGANQAVGIARLGHPVRMIGRLGTDTFGEQLRTHLESAGVNVDGVATSEGPSGVATIVVSSAGENCIVVTPGANLLVGPDDIAKNIEIIREAGIVLSQLEIPIETVDYLAEVCAREKVPLVLDPAPAQELPPSLLKNVAWFTPNQSEARFFTGIDSTAAELGALEPIARAILGKGCHAAVLKLGSQGAYVVQGAEAGQLIRPVPVKAVDSTAAGDAFNAGFATGLSRGKSPIESARFASAVAGISVTRCGAQSSMPSLEEVEELMLGNLERSPV